MDTSTVAAPSRGHPARRFGFVLVLCACMLAPLPAHAMRIAFGDIAGIDSLNLLIAVERARERGVDIELQYFESEDIAAQAVAGGDADLGIGSPYDLIQQSDTPIQLVYQLGRIRFFPVVDTERYETWSDLDGEEITVHSRGSATEAIAEWMAAKHDIEYRRIHYVPGSEVMAGAMLAGTMHAAIVDASGWHMLRQQGSGRFRRLPTDDLQGTDDALYTLMSYIDHNRHELHILLEEMLRTWRQINAEPSVVSRLRDRYELLPYLPQSGDAEIVAYYRDSVANEVFPRDGGNPTDVRADRELYAGGNGQNRDVTDFWNFEPLQQARQGLGEE